MACDRGSTVCALCWALFVAVLVVFVPSSSAAYYVATGGSDSADGLSLGTAWATLGHAQQNLSGQASVGPLYIGPGNFSLSSTFNLSMSVFGDSISTTNILLSGSGAFVWAAVNNSFPGTASIQNLNILSSSSAGAVIQATSIGFNIQNVSLTAANAPLYAIALTSLTGSNVVSGCSFSGFANVSTGLSFLLVSNSTVLVENTSFKNVNYFNKAVLWTATNAVVAISFSTFDHVYGAGTMIFSDTSTLTVQNSALYNGYSTGTNAALTAFGGDTTLSFVSIKNMTSDLSSVVSSGSLGAANSFTLSDSVLVNCVANGLNVVDAQSTSVVQLSNLTILASGAYNEIILTDTCDTVIMNNVNIGAGSWSSNVGVFIYTSNDVFVTNLTIVDVQVTGYSILFVEKVTNGVFTNLILLDSIVWSDQYHWAASFDYSHNIWLTSFAASNIINNGSIADFHMLDYLNVDGLWVDSCYSVDTVTVDGMGLLRFDNSQISNNYNQKSSLFLFNAYGSLSNNIIFNNNSTFTSALYLLSPNDLTFSQNKVMNNSSPLASPTMSFRSSGYYGYGNYTFIDEYYSGNIAPPANQTVISAYTCGGSMVMQQSNAIFGGGQFLDNSAICVLNATAQFYPSPSTGLAPWMLGLSAIGGSLELFADLHLTQPFFCGAYEDGVGLVIQEYSAYIYGNGHSMTFDTAATIYFGGIEVWDATIVSANGPVVFYPMLVDQPSLWPPSSIQYLGLNFYNSTYIGTGDSWTYLANAFNPVVFDENSELRLDGGNFLAAVTAPQTLIAPTVVAINSSLFGGTNFNFTGNAWIESQSIFDVLPNHYDGFQDTFLVNAIINIASDAYLGIDDTYEQLPFPPLSLSDDYVPALTLVNGGQIYVGSGSIIGNGHTDYHMSIPNNTLLVKPIGMHGDYILDPSLSSISATFFEPVNYTVPSDCSGFLNLTDPVWKGQPVQCVQKTPNTIVVSGTVLPTPNHIFPLSNTNGFMKSRFFGVQPPTTLIPPVAVIRPIPSTFTCGSLILDGTPSTGFGSYAGSFIWILIDSSAPASQTANLTQFLFLLPFNQSVVEIPPELLSPGTSYSFGLIVMNLLLQFSDLTIVGFTTSANFYIPPLTIEGPAFRTQYMDQDAIITSFVNVGTCQWNPTELVFEWVQVSDSGAETPLSVQGSSSSVLSLPASSFSAVGQTLTYKVYAMLSPSLGLPSGWNSSASVSLATIARPMTLLDTSRTWFVGEDVDLSVAAVSYSGETISYKWAVIQCPINYANNSFANVYQQNIKKNFECISPTTGNAFVLPLSNRDQSSTSITWTKLEPGTYTVSCTASTVSESASVNITFQLLPASGSPPPKVALIMPDATSLTSSNRIAIGATVNGVPAEAVSGSFNFAWSFSFGQIDASGIALTNPSLVIPHSRITANQAFGVRLMVTSKTALKAQPGIGSATLPIADSPSSGTLLVTPSTGIASTTLFNLSATQWSSLGSPIRYQFSVDANDGRGELPVTEWTLSNTINGVIVDVLGLTSSSNATFILRIMDGLQRITTVTANVPLSVPSPSTLPDLASLLLDVATSANASNWRLVNIGLRKVCTAVQQDPQSLTLGDEQLIWAIVSNLSSSVSTSDYNIASVLGQLNYLLSVVPVRQNASSQIVSNFLQALVRSPSASYGSSNFFSGQASGHFISSVSQLVGSGLTNMTSVDPTSLISAHNSLVLNSLVPGESDYVGTGHNLSVSVGLVNATITSASPASSSPGINVSFDASSFSSAAANGYIGYSYALYDGHSYPYWPSNAAMLKQVVDIRILTPGGTLQRGARNAAISTGQVTVTFHDALSNSTGNNIPAGSTPSCHTYSSTSSAWDSTGCTTSTSNSDVTCTCNPIGGLTVLFSVESNNPTPQSKATMIAAIVVVLAVFAACATTVFVVATRTDRGRQILDRVLSQRNPTTSTQSNPQKSYARAEPAPRENAPGSTWVKPTTPSTNI